LLEFAYMNALLVVACRLLMIVAMMFKRAFFIEFRHKTLELRQLEQQMAICLTTVAQFEWTVPSAQVWCERAASVGAAALEATARLARIIHIAFVRRVERSPQWGSQTSDFLNITSDFLNFPKNSNGEKRR